MKHNLILVVLLALTILTNTIAQTNWFTLKSTEENFMISLPSKPQEDRNNTKTPLGNGHHIYSVESKSILYTVSYSSFDNPITNPKDNKKIIDSARDLILTVTGGKLLSDEAISLGKFSGREIKIQQDKSLWSLRVYIVKERIYQLLTNEPNVKDTSAESKRFFDSFKLITPPE